MTSNSLSTLRLLQLCSSNLPVGGFSFSQGLECAVEQGWLKTPKDIADWVATIMGESLARQELPLLLRLKQAYASKDKHAFQTWQAFLLASRESAEMYQSETVMGQAMYRLLNSLKIETEGYSGEQFSYLAGFAIVAQHWGLSDNETLHGYLWTWLESQVAAAIKLLPMGQTDGQKILLRQSETIPQAAALATSIKDKDIGANLPSLAMASAWHETQYSRLFRS
jgi:urease accessory protein